MPAPPSHAPAAHAPAAQGRLPATVLHVVDRLDRENAGLSMAALRIASAQAAVGLKVRVTGVLTSGGALPAGAWSSVEIDPAPGGRALARRVLALRNRPECLVHLHGLWNTPTRASALLGATPYVVSPHGMLEPLAMAQKRLKKVVYLKLCEGPILRHASGLHALTPLEASRFSALHTTRERAVIPNPVESAAARGPSLEARGGGPRTILFLGRVNRMKGVPELVAAFVALQRQGATAGWRLVIAGWCDDAALHEELQAQAARAEPGSVALMGPVFGAQKDALVAASALFVLPSHHEALPMAALEAMAAGVPVCVSPECNLHEAIEGGAALEISLGRQLEPDLAGLLRVPDEALAEVSRRGRQFVDRRFSYAVVGRQFLAFYRSVMRLKFS